MYYIFLFLPFLVIKNINMVFASEVDSFENLHDVMNEHELEYYFQTANKNEVPDYEVVFLPSVLPVREALVNEKKIDEIEYSFSAFEKPVNLRLRRNSDIIAPSFKTYIHNDSGISALSHVPVNCHYLHKSEDFVAALSICNSKAVQGMIFMDNSTFEIHPLPENLQRIVKSREPLLETNQFPEEKVPHIIKRANNLPNHLYDDIFPTAEKKWHDEVPFSLEDIFEEAIDLELQKRKNSFEKTLTVELALFFDEAAYKIFAPHMNYDDRKLQDMLLAYMNGVQALYHHPSLGTTLDLVLVRLDIMKKQPKNMPHYGGERGQLLDSFCDYQQSINPPEDSNPEHWDMALYVSGLDFFAYENGKKSGVTMGLATVGGVCMTKYACIIAEFGTTNVFGKPYPSAGFTSVYILAHEIGHNLGMHHDSSGNSCSKEGYIMSPSRGTNGETQWSTCSADVMRKLSWAKCLKDSPRGPKQLDHTHFLNSPGLIFTAKRQCEILLRDKDAFVPTNQQMSTICYSLQCKTPHRSGFYFAGPALEGTQCGNGKYCYGGDCIYKQPPKPVKVTPGGWSGWNKKGKCNSGCIEKAMGTQKKERFCNNPKPVNTDVGCEGPNFYYSLCKDYNLCSLKRLTAVEYASKKCREFSKLLPELDGEGSGLQAPHEEGRVWMGCAIFCKRKDTGSFYTPRIELNDLGTSPYFPDGTWCHQDNTGQNYYCVQHHCLPENFKFTKTSQNHDPDDILNQNAGPLPLIPQSIINYYSISSDGKPLQTSFTPGDVNLPGDNVWETKDYVELPKYSHKLELLEEELNDLNYF